jgi:hypothetical protein
MLLPGRRVKIIGREYNDLSTFIIKVKDAFLLEDYRLMLERRLVRPDDLESYAGGSVSSW